MKKVLLIGDSIRQSYQDEVKLLLSEEAEVFAPPENCRFSKFALWGMHVWLKQMGSPEIDVVHWNAGIWDLHRVTADGEVFTPPDEYVYYTERLYIQMKHTAKKQIWASTIPNNRNHVVSPHWKNVFHQGKHVDVYTWEEWNQDVMDYNRIATELLSQKGDVAINDLYAFLMPHLDEYIGPDGVHLTPEGAKAVGRKVADNIREFL